MENQVTAEQLVADHHQVVYGYAFRLTGNQADAEDVTQQTFLTAHRCLDQLRQPERPVPWLLSIARSCWLKSVRRQRPTSAGAVELNVNEVPGPFPADDEVDREQLQLALDQLSDEFRLPLVMFYFEELSYKEIAAQLNIADGTVMSRLSRAKSQLRKLLAPAVVPNEEPSEEQATNSNSETAQDLTRTTPN